MRNELMATVVGGKLNLDQKLSLPDQTRVRLTIETIASQPSGIQAWESLKARLQQRPVHRAKFFTRDELYRRDIDDPITTLGEAASGR